MQRLLFLFFTGLIFVASSCGPGSDDDGPAPTPFDRKNMLETWAITVRSNHGSLGAFLRRLADEIETPGEFNPEESIKDDFRKAYISYQMASPLLIAKAEEIGMRTWFNTYPTDPTLILENITLGDDVNLELPSNAVAQGFPALDYLIYNHGQEILNDPAFRAYALRLVNRMKDLNESVITNWEGGYRILYVNNDGSSATASVDRTVNDYIFHFEKFLRAGKVGIPAGVFSDDPLADRAESLYGGQSKELFLTALTASEEFFNSDGLARYLNALVVQRDGEALSKTIKDQFVVIRETAEPLSDSFSEQVETDNAKMLALYDEMQKLVILLKVDMLQALSINVDYVDADGD